MVHHRTERTVSADELLTPEGDAVDASPDRLSELLREYESLLVAQSFPVDAAFNPGVPEEFVREKLAAIELMPPQELIVWFGWHNGQPLRMMPPLATATALQFFGSVEYAVETLKDEAFVGAGPGRWHPNWLRIGQHLAIDCATLPGETPYVCAVFSTSGMPPEETYYQRRSLCTPIVYAIESLKNGSHRWNTEAELWDRDDESLPLRPFSSGYV